MTKDYSRKPYQTKASYPEMIRQTPARAFWNSITEQQPVLSEYGAKGKKLTATERRYLQFLKQSEAKKPYLADDYQSMEYEWEGLPGLIPQNPHIDHPWMPDPQPTGIDDILPPQVAEEPEPQSWILYAFTNNEYCAGNITQITVNGTYPIYDIEFTSPISLKTYTSFTVISGLGTNTVVISLIADIEETGNISMRVYEEAADAPPLPSTQGRGWTGFPVPQKNPADCPMVFTFRVNKWQNGSSTFRLTKFYAKGFNGATPVIAQETTITGDYKVTINPGSVPGGTDTDGYYIAYGNTGPFGSTLTAIRTQYPSLYKEADCQVPGGELFPVNKPGFYLPDSPWPGFMYEDEIHFIDKSAVSVDYSGTENTCFMAQASRNTFSKRIFQSGDWGFYAYNKTVTKQVGIRASVEYSIAWDWGGEISYYSPFYTTPDPGFYCGVAICQEKCTVPSTWTPVNIGWTASFLMQDSDGAVNITAAVGDGETGCGYNETSIVRLYYPIENLITGTPTPFLETSPDMVTPRVHSLTFSFTGSDTAWAPIFPCTPGTGYLIAHQILFASAGTDGMPFLTTPIEDYNPFIW